LKRLNEAPVPILGTEKLAGPWEILPQDSDEVGDRRFRFLQQFGPVFIASKPIGGIGEAR